MKLMIFLFNQVSVSAESCDWQPELDYRAFTAESFYLAFHLEPKVKILSSLSVPHRCSKAYLVNVR